MPLLRSRHDHKRSTTPEPQVPRVHNTDSGDPQPREDVRKKNESALYYIHTPRNWLKPEKSQNRTQKPLWFSVSLNSPQAHVNADSSYHCPSNSDTQAGEKWEKERDYYKKEKKKRKAKVRKNTKGAIFWLFFKSHYFSIKFLIVQANNKQRDQRLESRLKKFPSERERERKCVAKQWLRLQLRRVVHRIRVHFRRRNSLLYQ